MIEKGYEPEQPVVLASCNTGTGIDSFAQLLADHLEVDVYAPTSDIYIDFFVYSTRDKKGFTKFSPRPKQQ